MPDDRPRTTPSPNQGTQLDKLLVGLDKVTTHLDGIHRRLDDLEAARAQPKPKDKPVVDDDDTDLPPGDPEGAPTGAMPIDPTEPGAPRRLAADEAPRREALLSRAQARFDSLCNMHGMQCPPPLMGEKIANYRRRMLRDHQRHSPEFARVDLDTLHGPALDAAERIIARDSAEASKNPSVPRGMLREVTRRLDDGLHIEKVFFGSPAVWLNQAGGRPGLYGSIRDPGAIRAQQLFGKMFGATP
jgi:hypothetical protein